MRQKCLFVFHVILLFRTGCSEEALEALVFSVVLDWHVLKPRQNGER